MRILIFLLLGAGILYVLAVLFVKSNPAQLARKAKPISIGVAFLLAAILMFTGRFGLARQIFTLAMGSAARSNPFSSTGRGRRNAGGASRVRTAMLEMELDHATGDMGGRVVSGAFAGQMLDDLTMSDLATLFSECTRAGDQSAAVLEAYLDRKKPDWRKDEAFEGTDSDPSSSGERQARSGGMSRTEALEILGLDDAAGEKDIRAAHRRLMKAYHPDQGGSAYLAARINQAKDVLLDG